MTPSQRKKAMIGRTRKGIFQIRKPNWVVGGRERGTPQPTKNGSDHGRLRILCWLSPNVCAYSLPHSDERTDPLPFFAPPEISLPTQWKVARNIQETQAFSRPHRSWIATAAHPPKNRMKGHAVLGGKKRHKSDVKPAE